ncbi:MAG: RNA methyltransferase [Rhodobacteraceae bacterium]|nr:RNA methyltransferase [Paracoccaceae bacterium]
MPDTGPTIVLVRPQMGENIGAAARAMLNFGLTRMRIVAPRDGWPNPKAVAMASGAAGTVLDHAGVFPTLPEAVADCAYIFATTARSRELIKPVMTPEEAMAKCRELAQAGQKTAILFGPERAGLENDDVARASAIISVPVNPDFPSLNLAQAVLLCAYEWRRLADGTPPEYLAMGRTSIATAVEIEKLGDHYENRLEEAGFFFPAEKADGMKLNIRNMWSRLALTRTEVQLFHGILRKLAGRKGQGPRDAPPGEGN